MKKSLNVIDLLFVSLVILSILGFVNVSLWLIVSGYILVEFLFAFSSTFNLTERFKFWIWKKYINKVIGWRKNQVSKSLKRKLNE